VRLARRAFGATPLGAAVADVRSVPFADASFDAIYSMGTIEHFPESQEAVTELARVLKPGGRLILGVPNLYDPFLRPLMVWTLQQFDAYHYGAERAFSRRGLHALLERAGLEVVGDSGVLFIPGWLRMLDLWCHARSSRLQAITALGVRLFERLDRRYPRLCRHGYLIASVGLKPSADPRR
jgi:SAM-dependent methyltransferase